MLCHKTKNMDFQFDEKNGQISKLNYRGKEYSFAPISIFEISQRGKMGEQYTYTAKDFCLKTYDAVDNEFSCVYENSELSVKINAEINTSINWGISVENFGEKVIEWINFPQIVVKNDLKDHSGDSKILWGFDEGVLVDNMEFRNSLFGYKEPMYPSEGIMGMYPAIVELQCMAYYDSNSGLYFASHDKSDNLKGIDFYEYNNGIKLQFRHFTGSNYGENYIMQYPMIMHFFDGDWYTAATIYREWFEKEKKYIPIEKNTKLPKWYSESPVIVTYPVRGLYDTDEMNPNKLFPYRNALKHIDRLEKQFNSKIMVILMHWEGTAPWAPPIVWPPYGGENELKKFIDALHERGDVLGVYCSGLGWTQKSNIADYNMSETFEKDGLAKFMCLSPEQDLPYSKICTDQRIGYDMCPTQKFTVDIICDQVNKMLSADIDYIQLMDQNHGGTSYFCYSKKHGHPPVPGKWQVDAVKKLLDNAEDKAGNVLFGCESAAAEAYIPQLLFNDNRYNICYALGEPIPLYAFVYHKYINNFMGNQVCTQYAFDHQKSPENIFLRIAYSFCCGDMLTAVINDDGNIIYNWGYYNSDNLPCQEATAELIKNLNYWRRCETKKYLHYGKMEIPYRIESDKIKIYGALGFDHEYCKVFSSAWNSSDGQFGQFLVNYTTEPVECVIDLPEDETFVVYEEYGKALKQICGRNIIRINRLSAVLLEKERL